MLGLTLELPKVNTGPFGFSAAKPARNTALETARASLLDFTCYTMPDYEVNWHHEYMCRQLDDWVNGDITRLMLFMPPRNGKSQLGSRHLPAYIMGRYPDASIIATSYSADLASRMNRDVQRIMDSQAYQQVFPSTQLFSKNVRTVASGTWLRNSEIFEVVGHKGVYRSAGVGGGITGMGGQFVIIDDPIKNQQEANSETYREALWEWYTSTLYTRLEKNARVLLIMTRWHEDDLAGRLLSLSEGDPKADRWDVITFPAIAESEANPADPRRAGEALWPSKYDVKALGAIRASVGSRVWNALYQQRPSAIEGSIFKRHWWRFWQPRGQRLPPVRVRLTDGSLFDCPVEDITVLEGQLQSWDMNFKEGKDNSFVVGQVWGWRGANRYLLDQVRGHFDFPETIKAVQSVTRQWPQAHAKLIEDKANGPAVIQSLRKEIAGLIAVPKDLSKEALAHAAAPTAESGNIYLPHPHIAAWVNDFVEELAGFPTTKHDDQVDAATQAINRLNMPRHKKPKSKEY